MNKKIAFIFILILGSTFIYSLINIGSWQIDNHKTENQIEEINKIIDIQEKENEEDIVIIEQDDVAPKSDPYWDYIKVKLVDVDFSQLKKINMDTKGWVWVNGTNVNYPFVQTTDNKYYLNHSFDKSSNQAGWVFLDYRNNLEKKDKNTIIYAHGRLDDTMFGSLKKTLTNNWLENKDNHIIKLSTEYENSLWQIFSIYRIPTTNDYIRTTFNNDEDFLNFTDMLIKRSIYNFNTSVTKDDFMVTLSTCYDKKDKIAIHAKLIKIEKK